MDTITVVITDPKTFRKELWIDGKLVEVVYPPSPGDPYWTYHDYLTW